MEYADLLLDRMSLGSGQAIADLGCGWGERLMNAGPGGTGRGRHRQHVRVYREVLASPTWFWSTDWPDQASRGASAAFGLVRRSDGVRRVAEAGDGRVSGLFGAGCLLLVIRHGDYAAPACTDSG